MKTAQQTYEIRHVTTFADTNLLGNVYYANHIAWQGHCREMFLREHVPAVLRLIEEGLVLATLSCSCDYFADVGPFEEITIRLRVADLVPTRLTLAFDYVRSTAPGGDIVARGEQQIACMQRSGSAVERCPFPSAFLEALAPFRTILANTGA
jgi:enediyne core biosynthesis thioesterase